MCKPRPRTRSISRWRVNEGGFNPQPVITRIKGTGMLSLRSTGLVAAIVLTASAFAQAHFLWIAPDPSPHESQVHVYFSETPAADDPSLLSRLDGLKLREISIDGKSHELKTV